MPGFCSKIKVVIKIWNFYLPSYFKIFNVVVPGTCQVDPPRCHTLAGRGRGVGRAPMGCGSHMAPQGVSLPPLSFFFPAKLDQKLFSRVLAVLEHRIFDLFAQPIFMSEIWHICSPVCDSSDYPSRILFGWVYLEYFAAVGNMFSELACLFYDVKTSFDAWLVL